MSTTPKLKVELQDCPICLETLTFSEQVVYPLPCQICYFNYCSKCVERFCKSAQDDFQVASDGSRQVKVTVSCPQCRTKYPMDIHELLLLRQVHTLGSCMIRNGELLNDSDLSASQLSWKRDFLAASAKGTLKDAYALYKYCMKGKLGNDAIEKEARVWKTLLEKLPKAVKDRHGDVEKACKHDGKQSQCGKSSKRSSPPNKKPAIDDTLFQGLHDFVSRDEKIFLTELLTSGDVRNLAQAAMILHSVLRLSMSGKAAALVKQNEIPMSKHEMQKQTDALAKTKASFPLPNHMPGYFLIPPYSKEDGFMTLVEEEWDGFITPPHSSQRVFDQIYRPHYQPPREEYPMMVVTVQSVRGPIGRLGLRRGDVVTHLNDVEWEGTAKDLQSYIYNFHVNHPREEISLTVNCNPATAAFLALRQDMIQGSCQPGK
jgi:hypothetical protein